MLAPKVKDSYPGTSTLNFPVPYEKSTTIESDSKQEMICHDGTGQYLVTQVQNYKLKPRIVILLFLFVCLSFVLFCFCFCFFGISLFNWRVLLCLKLSRYTELTDIAQRHGYKITVNGSAVTECSSDFFTCRYRNVVPYRFHIENEAVKVCFCIVSLQRPLCFFRPFDILVSNK